ncbi:hypothetical protein IQ255_20200 [Pleurocapsales cyanobacterium LEGE 10410]|nr:hypothetical protein [Pleurocapsales cyanobacterium LEGE 10410]
MNTKNVYLLSTVYFGVMVIGSLIVNFVLYGQPTPFFVFLNNVVNQNIERGWAIFGYLWYALLWYLAIEAGNSFKRRHHEDIKRFRTKMSLYTSDAELRHIEREQGKVLKIAVFTAAFFTVGLNEALSSPFVIESIPLGGRWLLHMLAIFLGTAALFAVRDRFNEALFLVSDKYVIDAEKQARAMREALLEEQEDRDDLGF